MDTMTRQPELKDSPAVSDGAVLQANGWSELDMLVPAAAQGDPEAWTRITKTYTGLLWSVARSFRLNQDDAADVVQNTWLRLLENLTKIERPQGLPKWLTTTARREALTLIRRRRREALTGDYAESGIEPEDGTPVDVSLLLDERDAHLWSCFTHLPGRDQQLLRLLSIVDGGGYAEVAEVLNKPIGSIGPTRMRALRRWRGLLEESGYPFDHRRPVTTPDVSRP